MDTPGDEIRKAFERTQQAKERQDAIAQEAEAKREKETKDRRQRADEMGQKFLKIAQQMREQARVNVYLLLERTDVEDPAFYLTIGQAPKRRGIRVVPSGDQQWQSTTHSEARGTSSRTFHTNDDLQQTAADLIKPLMIEAAEALGSGTEHPGSQR